MEFTSHSLRREVIDDKFPDSVSRGVSFQNFHMCAKLGMTRDGLSGSVMGVIINVSLWYVRKNIHAIPFTHSRTRWSVIPVLQSLSFSMSLAMESSISPSVGIRLICLTPSVRLVQ